VAEHNEAKRTSEIEIADRDVLLRLTGPTESHLRILEKELGVGLGLRGHTVRVDGPGSAVSLTERVLAELVAVLSRGSNLTELEIVRAVRSLKAHPNLKLRDLLEDVVVVASKQRMVTPKGVAQQLYVQAIREHEVVFGIGPAGTGKTYLAMAMAVSALLDRRVKRVVLTRPAVEAGEKLGFLPGDLVEKVNPYLRPLYDALHDLMDMDKATALLERGTIEVAPLAFMRGRTLNDAFVVLDEAQNTSPEQMKMFLTRIGFGAQAVITGDDTQCDLPPGKKSGLNDAAALLEGVQGVSICRFTDADVVRHPVVQRIVRAYDDRDRVKREEADRLAVEGVRPAPLEPKRG
jgi:phosphate starvation-inducible PhoH-like protein